MTKSSKGPQIIEFSQTLIQHGDVCRYLGRCQDRENYYAFPSIGNCCFSTQRAHPLEPAFQKRHCLGGDWASCPRYQAAMGEAPTQASGLTLLGKATSDRKRLWIIAGALAAVTVLAGLVLLLRLSLFSASPGPLIPTSSLTPVSETAIADSTRVAAGQSNPTAPPSATSAPPSPTPPPSRTPSPTHRPTLTSLPTSSRTPTPVPSTTPTRTASPAPTVTPTLTPTDTPTPKRQSTRTPTQQPTTTSTQRPTATSLPAPQLLAPADGQIFSRDDTITLQWASVGSLPADGYYSVTLAFSYYGDTWYDEIPWAKNTSWTVSDHDYLPDLSDDQLFRWRVQVVRRTGTDAEGRPTGECLSPPSAEWAFTWTRDSGDGGHPRPTPGGADTPPPPPPVQFTPTIPPP